MKMTDREHTTVAQDIVMFEEVLEMELKDAESLVFSSLKSEGEADDEDVVKIKAQIDVVKKELAEEFEVDES